MANDLEGGVKALHTLPEQTSRVGFLMSDDRGEKTNPLPTKIGNPAPVGLFAFALTTMMLMFMETGWAEPSFKFAVIGFAMFHGGLLQFIAGLFELYKGATFASVAFTGYGSFWLGWSVLNLLAKLGIIIAKDFKTGICLWFIMWGIFTFCLFLITLKKNYCLMVIFGLLWPAFFLLAAGVYHENVGKAGGYIGFFCGLSAFYTAYAEVVQDELKFKLPGL